jgi:glycosyltransferase 2 family protein
VKRHSVKFIAVVAVGLCLLSWFIYQLDWIIVLKTLWSANLGLITLGAVLMLCSYALRSLRWQILLRPVGHCRWTSVFYSTVLGFAAIFFVGRVGEFIRPFSLCKREPVEMHEGLASILIERLFDTVMVVALFGAALMIFDAPENVPAAKMLIGLRFISAGMIAASALGIFGLSIYKRRAEGALSVLRRKSARMPRRIAEPVLNLLGSVADGLTVLIDRSTLIKTVGITFLQWGLVLGFYWLTMAAFGLRVSLTQTIFVFGFAMLGSVLPTPGGAAGAFHAAAAGSLILLGVEYHRAASIAIVLHLVTFGPAVIMGLYPALRDGCDLLRAMRPQAAEAVHSGLDVEGDVMSPELESFSPYHSQLPPEAGQGLNV